MKTEELDHLIHHCLEGCLSESEAARLSTLLKDSAEARERYWATAAVHGLLEDSLQQASLRVITGQDTRAQNPVARWFQWRPLTSAAAGLAFGIFGASMVWAYALPMASRAVERTVSVLSEGFEDPQFTPNRRFPMEANQWSGDLVASVEAEAEVTPLEGQRMLRLTLTPGRKLSHAWRIVDLADYPALAHTETRRLEVSAAFNAPEPAGALRYRVRLAAFSQKPTALRAIWSDESMLFDTMIEQVVRNVWTKPDDRRWQTVQASLEIPPGTRSIVISLAAGATDPDQSPEVHYLDEVSARFVIAQTKAE